MRKQQKLKAKLRFNEYKGKAEDSYKSNLFEDVFAFSTGMNIKQAEASPDFATPCVRYGELYHMYNEVITTVINRTNIDPSELKFSDGDEILLPSAGEDPLDIGSACALTIKGVAIGRTINILKPKKANVYDQRFASYYINQKLRKKISTLARGASISNVYNSDLKQLEIILPTLPEQRKIADFLTAVDGRIQQLSQKLALLQDYKKGVMQQLFTQVLRFKDDHRNEFPDWEEKTLGDIGDTYGGLSGKSGEDFGDGKPYVTYKQIFDRATIDLSRCARVRIGTNENQNKVKKGDVLFTTSSETRLEVGYTSVLLEDVDELYLNSFCFGFRMNNRNELLPEFAQFLFHSSGVRRAIAELGQGSTRYNISKNQLMKQSIELPSLAEQTKISNFLTALDRKIESVAHQIAHTQSFKKGLLQQMFV